MSAFSAPDETLEMLADDLSNYARDWPAVETAMCYLANELERLVPLYAALCNHIHCDEDDATAEAVNDILDDLVKP